MRVKTHILAGWVTVEQRTLDDLSNIHTKDLQGQKTRQVSSLSKIKPSIPFSSLKGLIKAAH
jgi:hypothetical protein